MLRSAFLAVLAGLASAAPQAPDRPAAPRVLVASYAGTINPASAE